MFVFAFSREITKRVRSVLGGCELFGIRGVGAMDDITVVDFDSQIKEEIRLLRAQLALLLQEKEELLYHVCPELVARYAKEVGSYENRAHYQEYMILELKRRIEIARAALNREQTVSKETVDEQINAEYKAFYEKVAEERRRAEQAQKEQAQRERRRKESEQRWQAKYGSSGQYSGTAGGADGSGENGTTGRNSQNPGEGDPGAVDGKYIGDGTENFFGGGKKAGNDSADGNGNTREGTGADSSGKSAGADANDANSANAGNSDGAKAGNSGENKRPSLKDLYRKIIKKLHPDVNPNATEHEQELFRRATQAYEDGDIETLQEIYDEVFSGAGMESEQVDDLSPEELLEIKKKLEEQIRVLQADLNEIKSRNPYRYKELLDDPEKLSLVQAALQEAIRLYEEEIKRLNAELEKINQEMDELRRRKG